jgi:CRISPR-associated endonuclease/helicase Cas3
VDCLILLDEAHLSEAFRQTLKWVDRYRRDPWAQREPGPWSVVTLSATPAGTEAAFSLDSSDYSHEVLARRLSAAKPARLVKAAHGSSDVRSHAATLTELAWSCAGIGQEDCRPSVVATVVNRVGLARACHAQIEQRIAEVGLGAEAILLIGRTREVDRAALIREFGPRLLAGRPSADRTLFVTATQCIEAGADFDFDGLVSQIAPLDTLRQRAGRLNRLGRPIQVGAAVVACRDEVGAKAEDVVYGMRAKATWDWLESNGEGRHGGDLTIDLGISAMQRLLESAEIGALVSEKADAPIVMPAYVDLWAQTSPIPVPDPDVALFLHGAADTADVQIVWRADITLEDDEAAARSIDVLELMPPRAAETLSVPVGAARAWLAGQKREDVADVEGRSIGLAAEIKSQGRVALRWYGAGSDSTRLIRARQLRPGDLIVVPCGYGGCDRFGWKPASARPVADVADDAAKPYARRRFVFRLHPTLLISALAAEGDGEEAGVAERAQSLWGRIASRIASTADLTDRETLEEIVGLDQLPASWREPLASCVQARGLWLARPYDPEDAEGSSGVIVVAPRGIAAAVAPDTTSEAVTEDDTTGSFRSRPVPLDVHSADVAGVADEFTQRLGLDPQIAADVSLAARLHDEGKRDARFQAYLHHGDRFRAATQDVPLAKSGQRFANLTEERRARTLSLLPDRWRHEADSVRRAIEEECLRGAHDPELVLWLVGTHHGYGRPLYPHEDPRLRGPQDLDYLFDGHDWVDLFERLRRRYGTWGLAHLEAVLRLADHRASEREDRA